LRFLVVTIIYNFFTEQGMLVTKLVALLVFKEQGLKVKYFSPLFRHL
jgi:hypothetical protein